MPDNSNNPIENFASVFPEYLDAMVHLMIDLRRDFDGDLDMTLIMAVIGGRDCALRVSPEAPTLAMLGAIKITGKPSTNVFYTAQFTDIPRETVRCKVSVLVSWEGWKVARLAIFRRPLKWQVTCKAQPMLRLDLSKDWRVSRGSKGRSCIERTACDGLTLRPNGDLRLEPYLACNGGFALLGGHVTRLTAL